MQAQEMSGNSDTPQVPPEPVADAAMDAKMRDIWARFPKRWIRNELRQVLPPTRITSLGCEFIVHPRDNFTEFCMWEKNLPPEHAATRKIAEMLADSDAVIVDVGGNAGAFSLPILKQAGPTARAVVFEPNPVMLQRLRANIELNGFENVTVMDCAVGESEQTSRLYFPKNGNLGQGRVGVEYAKGSEAEGVDVAIRPLASCLAEVGVERVDFLKVDVEGLEDRVICPLLEADAALHPWLIYFEIAHDGVWDYPLLERLEQAGYQRIEDFDNNALFELQAKP